MNEAPRDREAIEAAFRRLLTDNDLREPADVQPHEDGGIICFWHSEKLAVVIDPE
jgi:hypothetical protein